MKNRSEIEEKYKWDLSGYFASQEEWEDAFEYVKKSIPEFKNFEGKLNEQKTIFDCLQLNSKLSQKLELLYVYAALITKEDQSNSQAQERLEKISSLATEFSAETSFIDVEIGELSTEFLTELMNNKDYPQFKTYFYSIIRFKPYMLSKKEEKLLSLMSDFTGGFGDNFEKFDDADLTFDDVEDSNGVKHPLNHSNFLLYLESPDRVLRKNTLKNLNGAYKKFNNFLSINYISNVKKNTFKAKIRNFDSCLSASIFAEDVNYRVYNTLIEQVNKNLPLLHEYFELKRKQLGLDTIALYDLYASTKQEVNLKLEYEEAM